MPRLICTFERALEILLAHDFVLHRHDGTNHRRYRGVVGGVVRMVDMSPHNWKDEIPTGTLQSIIRQSGLSQKLFRK